MSSSQNSTDKPRATLLVAEGGVPYRLREGADSIDVWIELMEAVEALCPRWPERARSISGDFRL